jgi:hypothetical protein
MAVRTRLKLRKQALFRDTERCDFCGRMPTTREHVYPRRWHKHSNARIEPRGKAIFTARQSFENCENRSANGGVQCSALMSMNPTGRDYDLATRAVRRRAAPCLEAAWASPGTGSTAS